MHTDTRARVGDAHLAYGGLLVFIVVVYANPGNWFDGWEAIPFAKLAAGASLFALGTSWLLYNRPLRLGGAIGGALVLLFCLVGLSASWSFWPKYSFDTFTDGLKYLAIFLLLVNTIDSEARLLKTVRLLALASCIPAFGAIWSHAHGQHLVEGDRAGWIGIFGNPNDLAYHLVVGVAMTLAAAASATSPRRRFAWWLLLAPLLYAILLTQSRGGMLATGTVGLCWLLRSWRRLPLTIGIACTATALVLMTPNNPFRQRTQEATAYGVDMSARGRIDAWRTGLRMAEARPLGGVGAGAFMIAWPEFAPGDAGGVRSEHDTYVQLAAELGLPGLLLFCFALGLSSYGALRMGRHPAPIGPLARGILCGLVGFAVCSIWGGNAWTWPVYLLFGLGVSTSRLGRVAAPRSSEDTVVAPLLALAGG